MQTRKCHADADANANGNADANRIRTKNNMSHSPSVGDINMATVLRGAVDVDWRARTCSCNARVLLLLVHVLAFDVHVALLFTYAERRSFLTLFYKFFFFFFFFFFGN